MSELVYWCLRHKASLEWWLVEKLKSPVHARAIVLTALMLRRDYTVSELRLSDLAKGQQIFPTLN